ncbi:Gfo/Idh/MocA family oxidoreductase [Ruania suaedae]|uniref:Gfo/Idh/MocA family protein n=1 Tax=Ruania suaedae TaxID=2897774 RepID=UPI001E61AFF7|nr:Gfo/Idh/MocA family oxidoreductase [Ruania suaedae]UFU02965.1 Gfo/Idh/MocA family oxidoreductase [Ruania suaedae]
MSIPPPPESAPVRVAVIGCGARASLARHVDPVGRATALVDPDTEARARTAEFLPGEPVQYATVADLLEAPGAVTAALVLTPDDTHAEVTIPLLEAGIAVFCEKPLAITTADADRILAVATRTGTPLYVGHNMRHMSVVRLMREIIDRGEIGEVKAVWCRHFVGHGGDYYFKDWHAERARSTGLLLQKGAHDIDVIHHLAGGYSTRVTGMGGLTLYDQVTDRRDNSDRRMADWFSLENWPPLSQRELHPVIDVEDLSMVQMQLDNGVHASYQQCHYTPDYWRNYTVIGTEGRLENFGDGEGGVVRVWNRRSGYRPDGDAEYPITGDEGGHGDADARTVAEFLAMVTDGAPTLTSPLAARHAVATAVAATESLRAGSAPREVPAPDLDRRTTS